MTALNFAGVLMEAKWPGTCAGCGQPIQKGERIEWNKAAASGQSVRHERCVSAALPTVDRPKAFAPTAEQRTALDIFARGGNLALEAGAGTGKTATLTLLAESAPHRRGQYVAFNRAIVADAGAKMPGTVNCSTAHSLAFRAVGGQYRERLSNSRRMRSAEIARRVGMSSTTAGGKSVGQTFLGGLLMAAVTQFCQSADLYPSVDHVPVLASKFDAAERSYIADYVLPYVGAAWVDLMSSTGVLPFRHDHYLKAWQLSDPYIAADYILFDECQDANPVMLAIVEAQYHAQRVYVGDSQQAIYAFTGAVNALDRVREQGCETAYLTQSFRFGPAVAEVANAVLSRIEDAELRLIGSDAVKSVVGPVAEPDAILTRTNATAVRTVMRLQAEGRRAALVGGGEEVVSFARAAEELMRAGSTEHRDLSCFDSWAEVSQYVLEDQTGGELRLLVKLVNDFTVPAILTALANPISEDDADVTVSTAHKSKGRQWPAVQLAGDFPPEAKMDDEELRLLYVAVTRAQRDLDISAVEILSPDTAAKAEVRR